MNNEEVKNEEVAEDKPLEKTSEEKKVEAEEASGNEKLTKKEIKSKYIEENKKLTEEVAKLKDDLLRNRAELENFKRRMNEERIKERKYASADLVASIINPLEYLTKACDFQTESTELANFLIGFKMIAKQLTDVLEADGLSEIIVSVGCDFDPLVHHAMDKEKREDVLPNKVIEVLSKGYKYKDRIIKPAMVKVSE